MKLIITYPLMLVRALAMILIYCRFLLFIKSLICTCSYLHSRTQVADLRHPFIERCYILCCTISIYTNYMLSYLPYVKFWILIIIIKSFYCQYRNWKRKEVSSNTHSFLIQSFSSETEKLVEIRNRIFEMIK